MDQMKLALGDINQQTDSQLPISGEPAPDPPLPADAEEPSSAVTAVRCLFLAMELRRLGQPHAADRWQAKAMSWLERLSTPGDA